MNNKNDLSRSSQFWVFNCCTHLKQIMLAGVSKEVKHDIWMRLLQPLLHRTPISFNGNPVQKEKVITYWASSVNWSKKSTYGGTMCSMATLVICSKGSFQLCNCCDSFGLWNRICFRIIRALRSSRILFWFGFQFLETFFEFIFVL